NGREMVADDVVQSFKRQIAEKFYASSLPNVDKLEAVDKSTVRITTSAPTADFLWSLGFCQTRIVPPETWAIPGDPKEGPIIGSGPVIFTGVDQWKQGDHCFLVRNPDYFIKGQPYVDRVEFYRIADAATLLSAFRSASLDVGSVGFAISDIDNLSKTIP